jgi:hypothetical protein
VCVCACEYIVCVCAYRVCVPCMQASVRQSYLVFEQLVALARILELLVEGGEAGPEGGAVGLGVGQTALHAPQILLPHPQQLVQLTALAQQLTKLEIQTLWYRDWIGMDLGFTARQQYISHFEPPEKWGRYSVTLACVTCDNGVCHLLSRYTGPRFILSSARVAFLHPKAEHLARERRLPVIQVL